MHKGDPCMECAQKIEEHHKKSKAGLKSSLYEEASKMYHREYNIRKNE